MKPSLAEGKGKHGKITSQTVMERVKSVSVEKEKIEDEETDRKMIKRKSGIKKNLKLKNNESREIK